LDPGQVLLFVDYREYGETSLEIGGVTYQVKKELPSLAMCEKKDSVAQKKYYAVIGSFDELPESVTAYRRYDSHDTVDILSFNVEGEEEACGNFSSEIQSVIRSPEGFSGRVDSVFAARSSWYADYGGFLFLGIFLGLMFMMATVLIIYYKQISEGYDDHDRFQIMQKVGMSKREVKKTIRKQILMVFFLPLLAAACHVAFAFRVISKLLMLFSLTNVGLFLLCTLVSLVVFGLIYALVYALTAKTYYRLVEARP
jgi:putative ABC transport system permease protein